MRKTVIKALSVLLICSVLIDPVESSAEGKTIGAYKCTKYTNEKGSDAKTIYQGVKGYDSNYSGEYLEAASKSITSNNFYDKSKTIKYWSSHGLLDGTLYGNDNNSVSFNIKKSFSWAGGKLEFVFLAACNQLNKDGGPLNTYANAMLGAKAVRVICGYHSKAPDGGDNLVAKKFMDYAKTGESVKSSWIKANEYVAGLNNNQKDALAANYAVLTHSGNVQYSRFPGFPGNTYTRPDSSSKKILRFRKNVENEEVLKTAKKRNTKILGKMLAKDNLEQKPVKFEVNPTCEEMVFNDEDKLSLDGGEVKANEVELSKSEIYKEVTGYVDKNLLNSEKVDLIEKEMIVEPILMDNALSDDREEKVVAYSVTFPHIYDGYIVEGDKLVAIVDGEGVKYTAVNWNEIQERGK